jgi:pyruvate kinase
MMRRRNAKIVATLGPASSNRETIRALYHAGADVFRLNFSHGSHEVHQANVEHIRAIEQEVGRPIGILIDLQGPKLRVGKFKNGRVELTEGTPFRLDLSSELGDETRAPMPHPEIFAALIPGTELLLDDGKIRVQVQRCGADFAETIVKVGGPLSDRKGVNAPGVVLPLSALTEKDRADLAFALTLAIDWVALSFVQRPEDVIEARKLVGDRAGVLSKLEKPSAIDRLKEIVDLSDAIMVARGDLGVEMPAEDVPCIQKRVISACRQAGKPVVVATQMLESMIQNPTPTRAEASDVATAVYDGADAVMLSAETAAGAYPLEAVTIMDRIIARVEQDPVYRKIIDAEPPQPESTASDAISAAAKQAALTLSVAATVTYTFSGWTALRASRERPSVPILGLTPSSTTARRLAIAWGIQSVQTDDIRSFSEMAEKACRIALNVGIAEPNQRLIITAGVPFGKAGATNIMHIAWTKSEQSYS